jgi:hypothetical protein
MQLCTVCLSWEDIRCNKDTSVTTVTLGGENQKLVRIIHALSTRGMNHYFHVTLPQTSLSILGQVQTTECGQAHSLNILINLRPSAEY